MHTLRSVLLLFLALVLASSAHGQTSRTVTRTVDLASGGTVTLDTYKGRVDVQTWDRSEARVEVRIEGDEQSHVDNTKIRLESNSDRLEIETDYDEVEDEQKLFGLFRFGPIDRPSTAYTLKIPRSSNLTVNTYSAATTVTDLDGDLQFDAYSAPLTVNRLTGTLQADTYSGSTEVGRVDGTVRADTYSGSLRADSIAGAVDFSTYSGSATLTFVALTDDCSFDTYSGSVTARLASGMGAVIETEEGALDTDRAVQIERLDDDRIRATLGEGGPRLRFDTFSGTLSVHSSTPNAD